MKLFKRKRRTPVADLPEPDFPVLNGMPYMDYLASVHAEQQGGTYLEIGTESGRSLAPARGDCVAIDPQFKLTHDVIAGKKSLYMYQGTSDEFFASGYMERNALKVDFAFLDGMHLFEYLLRDLINTERYLTDADATVMLHDCVPFNRAVANRVWDQDKNWFWTGDVWKLLPILAKYRPEVDVTILDCPPTGLAQLTGLDPSSTVLSDNYDAIVADFMEMSLDDYGIPKLLGLYPMKATA